MSNHHVIGDASEPAVAPADGTVRPTVVGADTESGTGRFDIEEGLQPVVTMDGVRNVRRGTVDVHS